MERGPAISSAAPDWLSTAQNGLRLSAPACLQEDSLDGSSPALQLPLSGTVDERLWLEGSALPAQSPNGAQQHLEIQALLCLQQQHRDLERPAVREPVKPAGSPLMLGAWASQQASFALAACLP